MRYNHLDIGALVPETNKINSTKLAKFFQSINYKSGCHYHNRALQFLLYRRCSITTVVHTIYFYFGLS